MDLWAMVLLGVGLAMDACAVAMTNGLSEPKMSNKKGFIIALFFGLFQGCMPLIGYFAGNLFVEYISQFTPWIALILLCFIGIKMIIDSFNKEEETKKLLLKNLFLQAITTSIDALAVGIIFVSSDVANPTKNALIASLVIMLVTFSLSFIAVYIGKKFGNLFKNKAQIFGGIILIFIGIKIFIDYLLSR